MSILGSPKAHPKKVFFRCPPCRLKRELGLSGSGAPDNSDVAQWMPFVQFKKECGKQPSAKILKLWKEQRTEFEQRSSGIIVSELTTLLSYQMFIQFIVAKSMHPDLLGDWMTKTDGPCSSFWRPGQLYRD